MLIFNIKLFSNFLLLTMKKQFNNSLKDSCVIFPEFQVSAIDLVMLKDFCNYQIFCEATFETL